jgi:hypothetical protein
MDRNGAAALYHSGAEGHAAQTHHHRPPLHGEEKIWIVKDGDLKKGREVAMNSREKAEVILERRRLDESFTVQNIVP